MENKLQIIEKNYDLFLQCAINICKGNTNNALELLQECIIYVNDIYSNNTIDKSITNDTFKYLFIFILNNEYKSKTSYYYRRIRKWGKDRIEPDYEGFHSDNSEVEEYYDKQYDIYYYEVKEKINNIIKELEEKKEIKWWEGEVWKLYYLSGDKITYREIKKMKGISIRSIYNAIHNVADAIKPHIEKLKNEYTYLT